MRFLRLGKRLGYRGGDITDKGLRIGLCGFCVAKKL